MATVEEYLKEFKELTKHPERIRNFCTSAHIHHGKTAMTDNLLAASGFMSEKAAGSLEEGMATWQHLDEQERLLTVDAANVSMAHTFDGQRYLINMIDTPGHVDFGGNVTRAMRAIDGTVVLICAVEGIKPQTEAVVKQALRERVKPVLFINKVDRAINELKLTPEQMQERFTKLILEFNKLVESVAEDEYKEKWKVNILDGSVCFGSARENWAMSIPYMKKKNVSFKDIIKVQTSTEMKEEEKQKWFWEHAPLHEVILDMIIKHLPAPIDAQKYRIPHIWKGDLESPLGKDLMTCNPNGKVCFVITRIMIDPKFGREMSAGRLFSGTIKEGMDVYLNNAKLKQRITQVYAYRGIKPESIGEVPSGNVIALGGISGFAGETITLEPEEPFTELAHMFDPVITKSIEPMKPSDLPKLVEILRKVAKEDPSIKIDINQETGENLMHGMGELHLEIIENRIKTERGLEIKTSPPIVVYRESITRKSGEFEGKSPNKHNKFYVVIEPLSPAYYAAIKDGSLQEGRVKKKDQSLYAAFEKLGADTKFSRGVREIYKGNILVDNTRGVVNVGEVQEMINDAFEQVMKEGPLAREPCVKMIVYVNDLKLHEDAIHRGPAQVYPAVREAIKNAMVDAGAVLYEPIQTLQIEAKYENLSEITKLVQNKRGQLIDFKQEGEHLTVMAKLPVGEMFGLASDLRSATNGQGTFFVAEQGSDKLPSELQEKIKRQIRTRKGLNVDDINLS
ncbi:MAG TPA: elongation factor EF-2 [Candidatus Nanoarchaeia archaeon]|nr:elongation factor EF-2 [Candidatus Nanoarchaeia archaeon]